MRRIVRSATVLCGLGVILGNAPASAQLPSPGPRAHRTAPLDVPYLPQSELLCGGAAVAMVERWWGRRGVYAEDFAGLLRPELRGIGTTDLAAATRTRGWETRTFDGGKDEVQRLLASGVPVIALLAVAPDRFHYVVLLEWSDGQIVFHDPARAPARMLDESRFLQEWNGAERWAMTLRPGARPPPDSVEASRGRLTIDSLPCRPWLDRALDAVAADRLEEAAGLLTLARQACPVEPRVLRELAGIRFRQRRLTETIALSERYLARAPEDTLGWQLLAASRYLAGDRDGALAAWNRNGRPAVDLLRVDGLQEVRFEAIAAVVRLPHGMVLTPARLALARRRTADLPALRRATVQYQPVGGGLVEVRAAVAERPVLGPAWRLLAAAMLHAVTQQEVGVSIASPTGAGELWTGVWRWEHAHPRVVLRVDLPAHLGFSGIIGVEGTWERFRFAVDTARNGAIEETRHVGGVGFGGWVTPALRPIAGLRVEQWSGGREYLTATAGAEIRAATDRLVLFTTVEYGRAIAPRPSYMRGDLLAAWSSSSGLRHAAWSARVGMDLVSDRTPVGIWPVASGDIARAIPLRAHPRTSEDLLPGSTAGRRMLHGGLSGDHPMYHVGPFLLAAGLFLDAAEIVHPASGASGERFYLDAGGGFRIAILDGQLGVVRIDLATGLTDRRTALTIGLHQSWPPFREMMR